MVVIKYNISLDLCQSGLQAKINAIAGDTKSRMICASLRRAGTPVLLTADCTAIAKICLPSGKVLFSECGIEDGQINHTLTSDETSESGNAIIQFIVYGGENVSVTVSDGKYTVEGDAKVIGCPKISMLVENNISNDNEAEASDSFTALTAAILAAQEYKNAEIAHEYSEGLRESAESERISAETARTTAEESRAIAEAERQSNEAARASAENTRINAENERVAAEAERITAENERQNAETARTDAEADRQKNEKSRVKAETERASAENNRQLNESARNSAETARTTAEESRVSAESERQSDEAARASAENTRISAENERLAAETARVTAENERQSAEAVRQENEAKRQEAYDSKADIIILESQTAKTQSINDAVNHPIEGLNIYGNSSQDGTPTPTAPVDIVSAVNPTVDIMQDSKNSSFTLPETYPMRSVDCDGNVISDEFKLDGDGKVYHIQRIWAVKMSEAGNFVADGTGRYSIFASIGLMAANNTDLTTANAVMCTHFAHAVSGDNRIQYRGVKQVRISIYTPTTPTDTAMFATAEKLNEFLHNPSNNVVIQYPMAEPITTEITDSGIISAVKALSTYAGTTTITSEVLCKIKYRADTTAAYNNLLAKINELQSAVITLGGTI